MEGKGGRAEEVLKRRWASRRHVLNIFSLSCTVLYTIKYL
jgi:hypothetical protein